MHNESADSVNQGNYIVLVNFLRSTDKEFDVYLHNATVSLALQTIFRMTWYNVFTEIKKEIMDAQFLLILDETSLQKDAWSLHYYIMLIKKLKFKTDF